MARQLSLLQTHTAQSPGYTTLMTIAMETESPAVEPVPDANPAIKPEADPDADHDPHEPEPGESEPTGPDPSPIPGGDPVSGLKV